MLHVLRPSSVMSIQKPYTGRFCIFLCMFFVLTSLRMAKVQAKTCSIHERVTTGIKIIPCYVRLNQCDLLGQGLLGNNIVNIQQTAVTWNHLHDIRRYRKLTCRCSRCRICSMVVPYLAQHFLVHLGEWLCEALLQLIDAVGTGGMCSTPQPSWIPRQK